MKEISFTGIRNIHIQDASFFFRFCSFIQMHVYSQYLPHYNQSPPLKKITLSAFTGGTVLQQIMRFYFRSRVISYLYISLGWTNALVRERIHYPFHLLKHYIQLSIFSFVFLFHPSQLNCITVWSAIDPFLLLHLARFRQWLYSYTPRIGEWNKKSRWIGSLSRARNILVLRFCLNSAV